MIDLALKKRQNEALAKYSEIKNANNEEQRIKEVGLHMFQVEEAERAYQAMKQALKEYVLGWFKTGTK